MSNVLKPILVSAIICAVCAVVGASTLFAEEARERAASQYAAGNYKDAYEIYRKLLLDTEMEQERLPEQLSQAVQSLRQLGRDDEFDALVEAVVARHSSAWKTLWRAAKEYMMAPHYGFIVAGKFSRGSRRGGGRYVSAQQRDRVRSLQLLLAAEAAAMKLANRKPLAGLYEDFAQVISYSGDLYQTWRLQSLTDTSSLPDYDENEFAESRGYGSAPGIPVDAQGNPILYAQPVTYHQARNDGERYRWALAMRSEVDPGLRAAVSYEWAQFLRAHLDVQTIASFNFGSLGDADSTERNESGTYALHSLQESETIAKLATGIKRFPLPEEFNFIRILRSLAESEPRANSIYGPLALDALAQIFEDRRQYPKAADCWRRSIKSYGAGDNKYRQLRLDQIVGAWGEFERLHPQTVGVEPSLSYLYRNGGSVRLEAYEIDVDRLLADVRQYLSSTTGGPEYQKLEVNNIGYRLIERGDRQYLGRKAASWVVQLAPSAQHFDRRISITAPLTKAGAYLVTASMAGGNVSNIVLWVSDLIIVQKQLADQNLYFLADARNGAPVANATVNFFGYRQVERQKQGALSGVLGRLYDTVTNEFSVISDAQGRVLPSKEALDPRYSWLLVARDSSGRRGHLGFGGVWYRTLYHNEYNLQKTYFITDRPVYRPGQTVKFKAWVRHARYDQEEDSSYAAQRFTVQSNNPRSEKIFTREFSTDAFGGLEGEITLAKDATLGVYSLFIPQVGQPGQFRVEEYKKPEFEVSVDAPQQPVLLGERVQAEIRARYYFGAPVTEGRVRYKVLRYAHRAGWFPTGTWDWLYGVGYWWFAYDYDWYPGWRSWGCRRPTPPWWGGAASPPEVVIENEAPIGADGTLKIAIDTAVAKELHADSDHRYEITAEVVDQSRRTIIGAGQILVARRPFSVYAWVDRGHYQSGETVRAEFSAQTLDQKPVAGKGKLRLLHLSYEKGEPVESPVEEWELDTSAEGRAALQFKASAPGQFRLAYAVTDAQGRRGEGGYIFTVRGGASSSTSYRFNDLELVPDKKEYRPGERVRLLINTEQVGSTVLLFLRPSNGVYLPPEVLRLEGKSMVHEIPITNGDMPNFYVEALTIHNTKLHTELREILVPPEQRILNVALTTSAKEYTPGASATVGIKLTDLQGKPFVGTTVISMYDRALEYISGGSNVPEIRSFFWKWRRQHHPLQASNIELLISGNLALPNAPTMQPLGIFGASVADELLQQPAQNIRRQLSGGRGERGPRIKTDDSGGFDRSAASVELAAESVPALPAPVGAADASSSGQLPMQQPMIRRNFADTALWKGAVTTDARGEASIDFTMPENLSEWQVKVWAMGHGTKVGQAETSVVTSKNVVVRLQAPRFFVEKDEVVISANIHNYLDTTKQIQAKLEMGSDTIQLLDGADAALTIPSKGEQRVDWRVKVLREGEALLRVSAMSDVESDGMEQRFPVHVHGMLKTDSFSGALRPSDTTAAIQLVVPEARRVDQSRLEIRYSPSLAGAMVDALPYLVSYPYGCTEQTLNRFLPTIITQRVLQGMKLDLAAIAKKRSNLNSQEIGDDRSRARGWQRYDHNPVFDPVEASTMAAAGLERLLAMQLSDGGWGWFSGWGEHASPHMTAYVVHGLQIAQEVALTVPAQALTRGTDWLSNYQAEQVRRLHNAPTKTEPYKSMADDIDAFVYMVLVDGGRPSSEMLEFLFRDRAQLSVYTKAMLGIALHKQSLTDKLRTVVENIRQYVVEDAENQTAYLQLPNQEYWWYWYGSEYEAHSYYLKLLSRTDPKGDLAPKLAKYLLNNRKNATYWNSTRDTAITVEALAEFIKASGEDTPQMTVQVLLDGKILREVSISAENLFTFDNSVVIEGAELSSGSHTVELRRKGRGPLYYNAYLTNFTLEDAIAKSGLEVKVDRKFYRLTPLDAEALVQGAQGQALNQNVEKYRRTPISLGSAVASGDLLEVELEIESKNDYEYLIFEDFKAAGFEPLQVQSGYNGNDLNAYVEFRDDRVAFFVRTLARGRHSVSYRVRAEIPGRFSALPAQASAMYAPEIRGNSDEFKVKIEDRP